MLLSAGKPSDTLIEINRTINDGKQLAGAVKILAFGIGSGTFVDLETCSRPQFCRYCVVALSK